jgi:hypothetical protein
MQIKFKVNGQNWKIKTIDADEMKEQRADGDFAGLCVVDERMIYIDNKNIDFQTICHELYHAYFSYLHLDDTTELKIGDFEEITASHFAANAEEILKKAKQLTKDLKEGNE